MVSLEPVKITRLRNFTQYKKFIHLAKFNQVKTFAKKLQKVKITVVSATPYGGGVAEIWHSLTPIFHSLGLDICWYTISAPKQFFDVTKKFHNLLQGQNGKLTEAEKKLYLKVNKRLASNLNEIPTDILLVHDPQPAAIVAYCAQKPITIWRCHIDTSNPNRTTWSFLKQQISQYHHLIFTLPQYLHNELIDGDGNSKKGIYNQRLQQKLANVSIFSPTIDPFDEKLENPKSKSWKILADFGLEKGQPLIFTPSRFDPWKDLFGIFEAYLLIKRHLPSCQILFTGPLALDDPQGLIIRKRLLAQIKKVTGIKLGRDVFVYSNQDGFTYKHLAAAYTVCDLVIQKSLAEGFGLTVTEAGFHGKPVIGGAIGGIAYQIIDYCKNPEKATGILVDVTQADRGIADCAFWAEILLKDPKLAKTLGSRARRRVLGNFLHPVAVFNYLNLFNNLLELNLGRKMATIQNQSYYNY